MDEIARELGISKATLYKHFTGKEELLRAVVENFLGRILTQVESVIHDSGLDSAERLVRLFTFLGAQMSLVGRAFIQDIQKNAPEVWAEIDSFRREKIFKNFKILLEAGIGEGVFKKDVDQNIVLLMFITLVQSFLNPETLLRLGLSAREVFASIIKVFFGGILTDKARKRLEEKTPEIFQPQKEDIL